MPYVIALVAALGIVVIGSQVMLMTPEGWPHYLVALITFFAAVWAARFILKRLR